MACFGEAGSVACFGGAGSVACFGGAGSVACFGSFTADLRRASCLFRLCCAVKISHTLQSCVGAAGPGVERTDTYHSRERWLTQRLLYNVETAVIVSLLLNKTTQLRNPLCFLYTSHTCCVKQRINPFAGFVW